MLVVSSNVQLSSARRLGPGKCAALLQSAAECCRRKAAVERAAALLPLQGPARCRGVPATSSTTAAHHMIRGLSIKLSQAPVTVIAISVFAGHGDGGEANK